MIFGVLNSEKIWHQQLVHLTISPVYCSHFTLGNPKSHVSTVLFIHTSDWLRYLGKNKLLLPYPLHLKNVAPLPCKNCTNSSSFSFFHVYSVPIRYTDELRNGSVLLRHGVNFSTAWWMMQLIGGKKTGSMYPCRRWSLWTFAVTLLAWHSICRTSQQVLFRATNANPQPAHFRSINVWRNAHRPTSSQMKMCILQGGSDVFRCGG